MTRTGCSKRRRAGTHACFEDDVAKDKILEHCTKQLAKGDFGVCERNVVARKEFKKRCEYVKYIFLKQVGIRGNTVMKL